MTWISTNDCVEMNRKKQNLLRENKQLKADLEVANRKLLMWHKIFPTCDMLMSDEDISLAVENIVKKLNIDLEAAKVEIATIIDELYHFHKRVDKVGKITVAESWGEAIDDYVKELNKRYRTEAEKVVEGK